MRRLRVTADDLGFTPGVTDGVFEAHRRGIVTHASMMAGGLDFDRAASLVSEHPRLGVGVHLTLTWGVPLLPRGEGTTLVRADGRFASLRAIVSRAVTGRLSKRELEREWRAQLARVVEVGIVPTHLDSHHHVHLLPGCFEVGAGLAREFGIDWIRRPADTSTGRSDIVRSVKRLVLAGLCRRFWPVSTSDAFRGLAIQGSRRFAAGLRQIIQRLPDGLTELMVHPGKPDAALEREDVFVWERAIELSALCNPDLPSLLKAEGVELDIPVRPGSSGEDFSSH